MSRIHEIFARARSSAPQTRLLMPFVCAGHPTPGSLGGLLEGLERGGASIVEVGIPFSDPIADGPVIAAAMHEALLAGVTPASVFAAVKAVRPKLSIGLVAMVSVSIVHRWAGGAAGFCAAAADAGFDGFIFPDAPLEESDELISAARGRDLAVSLLVAPTTPVERAREIARRCSGFVYVLARTGITGERSDAPEIAQRASELRGVTDEPLAFGFGISTAEHVRAVVKHADAAIVGSALVRRLNDAAKAGRDPAAEAEASARELSAGLRAR